MCLLSRIRIEAWREGAQSGRSVPPRHAPLRLGAPPARGSGPRGLPVDLGPPLPEQPIGLAPREEAGVADVLVESNPDRGVAGGRAVGQFGPATARAEPEPPLLSGSLTKRLDIYGL